MRLLDLFCGAGGAAMGYHLAGFDEIVGVDIKPQPHYPFEFVQADAMTFPLDGFDAIHASPPCKPYTVASNIWKKEHPELLAPTRERLQASGLPWILENVKMTGKRRGTMPAAIELCGTMFGLHVYRHRYFETSWALLSPGHQKHPSKLLPGYVCIYGGTVRGSQTGNRDNHYTRYGLEVGQAAMGIDWMNKSELGDAIPPAYTEWLGRQLLDVLLVAA
jgi:DNA (cytosine-5)-methyltransferase 1